MKKKLGQKIEEENNYDFHSFIEPLDSSADKLNRKQFAYNLADSISKWPLGKNYTIALYGEWGSGKTWIKNKIIERIQANHANKVLFAEFNPWQWSEQQKIQEELFNTIYNLLGSKKGNKNLAKAFKKYANKFAIGTATISLVLKSFSLIIFILTLCSVFINDMARYIFLCLELALIASLFFESFLKKIAISLGGLRENKGLEDIKEELTKQLEKFGKPILITIDDVDRLNSEEIRALIQLVKANFELPNLVFLMFFPKSVVEKSLAIDGVNGGEFLEKIIQIPFDVPLPNQEAIDKILFDQIAELIKTDCYLEQQFDWLRWEEVYYRGLRIFFNNLRKVYRYMPSINFQLSFFKGSNAFNANPVDLFALEAIRIFENKAYKLIFSSEFYLTSYSENTDFKQINKERLELILSSTNEANRTGMKNILTELFPQTSQNYRYSDSDAQSWLRNLRICHPNWFQIYFQLNILDQTISLSQLQSVIESAKQYDDFINNIKYFYHKNLIIDLLQGFKHHKDKIDKGNEINYLTALLNFGDQLAFEENLSLNDFISLLSWFRHVFIDFLISIRDVHKRGEILFAVIERSNSICVLSSLLRESQKELEKNGRIEEAFFSPEDLEIFNSKLTEIFRKFTEGEGRQLADSKHFIYLLYRWKDLVGVGMPSTYVDKITNTLDGILKFLVFLEEGGVVNESTYYELNSIIEMKMLLSKIESFDKEGLEKEKSDLINRFVRRVRSYTEQEQEQSDTIDS